MFLELDRTWSMYHTLREKSSNTEFFSGLCFPVFGYFSRSTFYRSGIFTFKYFSFSKIIRDSLIDFKDVIRNVGRWIMQKLYVKKFWWLNPKYFYNELEMIYLFLETHKTMICSRNKQLLMPSLWRRLILLFGVMN